MPNCRHHHLRNTMSYVCGDEFGIEHSGKAAFIRHALYGGKASGDDFW